MCSDSDCCRNLNQFYLYIGSNIKDMSPPKAHHERILDTSLWTEFKIQLATLLVRLGMVKENVLENYIKMLSFIT